MNEAETPKVGRNEPCPCGSGNKYKRCHGVDAAPKLSAPKQNALADAAMPEMPDLGEGGMQWVAQFSEAMRTLPKGQAQRFQALAKKAMLGRDVSKEMEEFQKSLPLHMQSLMSAAPQIQNESQTEEPNRKNLWKRWFGKSEK